MNDVRVHEPAEADRRDATETATALTAGELRHLLEGLDDDTSLTLALEGPGEAEPDGAVPVEVRTGWGRTAQIVAVDPRIVHVT